MQSSFFASVLNSELFTCFIGVNGHVLSPVIHEDPLDIFNRTNGSHIPNKNRHFNDAVNHVVYRTVNNGVYRTGFARTQEAYEEAFRSLFTTLDELVPQLLADYLTPGTADQGEFVGTNFERKYRREGRPFHAIAAVKPSPR